MIIRQATAQDAADIAAVWNAEIRDGVSTFNSVEKTLAEVEEMIAQRGAATQVAHEGKSFLGFVTYGQFRGGIGYRHSVEHTIYLTPAAKGRGVGRALMARIYEVARGEGHHIMVAGIGGENADAIGFHTALGFKEVGRMPEVGRKFDRWMTLVLMQREL